MMIGKVNHILQRCREEGTRNSCRFAVKRLQKPLKNAYLKHKYTRSRPISVDRLGYPGTGRTGQFFFASQELPQMADWFRNHYPNEAIQIAERSGQILAHDFTWLCPNCPEFGHKIEWTQNFSDRRPWPESLYSELDYSSDARLGDVRELWELNRHQYFITLGKAYLLSGEHRYADEFLAQLVDWIEHNPTGYGINWLHSQEVALRAISWCWAFQFFANYSGFTDDLKTIFFGSLYAHADYIRWHLSDKPVTHNHLVTEACGLAVVGLAFPQLHGARSWRRRGIAIFLREIIKQVWEDGLDGELSTNYHCFVLDSFLQLCLLMRINHLPVPDEVLDRIEAMIEAAMYFMRPDGSLPLIGDNDNGRAFRLTEKIPEDRRAYLAVGAVLFDRSDFRQVAGRFHEEAFWLLGIDGYRKFMAMSVALPAETDKFFAHGGLMSSRTSWDEQADCLLVRGGPTQLRKGVSISHNHADLLSLELTVLGTPVLVDSGVYLYGSDDAWRFHFRKTLAHNTLVIDKRDQFEVCATRFGLLRLPVSTCHSHEVSADHACLDMTHSGYDDIGIEHRRRFLWRKGRYLLIVDEVKGTGSHQLDLCFHFNPALEVNLSAHGVRVNDHEGISLCTFEPVGEHLDSVHKIKGSTYPIQGWSAPRYGLKSPSPVVIYTGQMMLPVRLATMINLRPELGLTAEELVVDSEQMTLRIHSDDIFDQVSFLTAGCRFEPDVAKWSGRAK